MRAVIVWNEQTDYAREVREWLDDFERTLGLGRIESIDPETREGSDFAAAYDVVEYPTILALDEDSGKVLASWRGTPLPQVDQVAYWV
ncbi:hypothetical protein J6D24_00245 [Candidatus Saccharibacteria bacterium]|nr:hypothetical protein [Candidatus Saccharibacteria bacterium]